METRRRLRSKGTMRKRSLQTGPIKMNTDAISALLEPIYKDLPNTSAAGQHNLTYSEVEWSTLKQSIQHLEPGPGKFYDLGCGRGKAILYMSLSGLFESCVGIEVLPERVNLARVALSKLRSVIPGAGSNIKLYETSFLNPVFKYKDAKIVFVNNTWFDDHTQTTLFNKLNAEMPKGSLVVCYKIPSSLSAFETVQSSNIQILRHL